MYRCYILGGINQSVADKRLMDEIKRKQNILTEIEKLNANSKLMEDLERYKDSF